MDFFEHQDRARRRTTLLVFLYALAVAGIVLALYLAVLFVMDAQASGAAGRPMAWWQPELLLWVALGVGAVVLGGTGFKTAQLSRGGERVARSLGGRPIPPDTADPEERKLLNIVEEMALAAGISVPAVFLLADEDGINAFAAGFTPRDAVIGVTRGCVRNLSRDELQGVIAHEFSHIVHGDMRLNLRLMGVLFGILMLTVIGRILLRTVYFGGGRSRRSDKRGGNPLPLIGLALILVGYIGVFFASLIKSAVSRQREFLSDAAAVQYTRNPAGIAGALKKIAGIGAKIKNPHATEASHLFFGEAIGRGFFRLFATHPPLEQRIRRLDPAFDAGGAAMPAEAAVRAPAAAEGARAFAGEGAPAAAGDFGTVDLETGRRILAGIPDALRAAARDSVGARGLVYAVLLSGTDAGPERIAALAAADPPGAARGKACFARVAALPVERRLPLVELAAPALGAQPKESYAVFRDILRDIIAEDEKIDLFEYAIEGLIARHVDPFFEKPEPVRVKYRRAESVRAPCAVVLRALAAWGTDSPEAAQACFGKGMGAFVSGGTGPIPAPVGVPALAEVDRALRRLRASSPSLKRRLLRACRECVLADGRVAPRQYELLRAVADALDVPMPPLPFAEPSPG